MDIEFDYSKLRGRIKEIFGSECKFAEKLKISDSALSSRLNNRTEFKQPEILQSLKYLQINEDEIKEYFFTQKVRKTEQ